MKRLIAFLFLMCPQLLWAQTTMFSGAPVAPTYTRPTSQSITNSGNSFIDATLWNTQWNKATSVPASTFTYSTPTTNADMGSGSSFLCTFLYITPAASFVALDSAHQATIDGIYAELSTVIPITFVKIIESISGSGTHALLREIGGSNVTGGNSGFPFNTYCPPTDLADAGVSWFSPSYYGGSTGRGNFFDWGARHEILHAIGLKHPFSSGGSGVVAAAADCWTGITMVAYTSTQPGSCTTGSVSDISPNEPQTLMLADVAGLQYLYGMAASDGPTNITFDNSTCAYLRNGTIVYTPVSCIIYMNIVDTGGYDTLDLSNWSTNPVIDLTPGSRTNVIDATKLSTAAPFNFTISYSAVIEDYNGASGNDDLTANSAIGGNYTGNAGTNTLRFPTATFASFTVTNLGFGNCQFAGALTYVVKQFTSIIFSDTTKSLNTSTCVLT